MHTASRMLSIDRLHPPGGRHGMGKEVFLARQQPDNGEQGFEEILARIATRKDKEAFIVLFDYYAPRIKSFFMKSGLPADTADELAQETMLAVWSRASTYDPAKAAASTWIYTIARNKRIDFLRKRQHPEADMNDPLLVPGTPDAPDRYVAEEEETRAIAEAVAGLPPEQADLIRRSFFEDKTHADIAEETGLPLGTVKSRIRLAMERLRHSLGHTLEGHEL